MTENEGYKEGYYSPTGHFVEAPKKEVFRFRLPGSVRFSLIWTLFFIFIGIVIQAIRANAFDLSIIQDFFLTNYVNWFKSLSTFTDVILVHDQQAAFSLILADWYYFLYTAGVLSLIWEFISLLIHFEFVINKKVKLPEEKTEHNKGRHKDRIEEWLEDGLMAMDENRIDDAKLIYEAIKRKYDPFNDPAKKLHKRILEFYHELMKKKKK